jgi:hypothetical protein
MICNSMNILYPPFRKELENKMASMPKELNVMIFETYRSPSRQAEIFLSGNSRASAWNSWHQYGTAVDFVFIDENGRPTWNGDWDALGSHLKSDKIKWSWEWKQAYEKGHFEWRHGIEVFDARKIVVTDGQLSFWLKLDGAV